MKKNKPLTNIEWDTCWMAIRYAMGRKSISSAMLPRDLLSAYFDRWTLEQRSLILRDLKEYYETHKVFGDYSIDHDEWMKFMLTLDVETHYEVLPTTGEDPFKVFDYLGKMIPLSWYKHVGNIFVINEAVKKA